MLARDPPSATPVISSFNPPVGSVTTLLAATTGLNDSTPSSSYACVAHPPSIAKWRYQPTLPSYRNTATHNTPGSSARAEVMPRAGAEVGEDCGDETGEHPDTPDVDDLPHRRVQEYGRACMPQEYTVQSKCLHLWFRSSCVNGECNCVGNSAAQFGVLRTRKWRAETGRVSIWMPPCEDPKRPSLQRGQPFIFCCLGV
ncbi:hypothetical protein GGTG_05110 [Gaeumannomyces tritici R3-111a-1]|uniref:Uncharacterized protein n=1 Tax=Gaeumannomyces tritici (strain R3-111a-1) TaxID=644352 RepID=J3NV01_GAET3|nr:hypothetical protein GGTG_05110 [Gaeumannomyces tritici R3-111a-1]EJT75173.1 hypothetical protein GGTG_05110 [Gaeumannomyces tritici R3-111a-1]